MANKWLVLTFLHNGFVDCGLAFGQVIPLVTGECAVCLRGFGSLLPSRVPLTRFTDPHDY